LLIVKQLLMEIYRQLSAYKKNGQKLLAVLLDPDKVSLKKINKLLNRIRQKQVDFLLVGGSLLSKDHFKKLVKKLKKNCSLPVLIFPGNTMQISKKADALLLLSLISGRNPDFLIGKHVEVAPLLHKSGLETIAAAYLLIEN